MKWNWIGPPTRNLEYGIGDITEKPYYTADKNPAQEEFPNEVLAIKPPERKQAEEVTCDKSQQGRRDS